MKIKRNLIIITAALSLLAAILLSCPNPEADSLNVQISYTGSTTVNDTHKIFLSLYFGETSISGPIDASGELAASTGTLQFTDVTFPAFAQCYIDKDGDSTYDVATDPSGDVTYTDYGTYQITIN